MEDSPSPVYGAALLMRLGVTTLRGSNPRSSAARRPSPGTGRDRALLTRQPKVAVPLGWPSGPSRAIGSADPRPSDPSQGIRRLRGKRGTSRIRLQGVSHTRCVSPSPQPASPEQRLIIISGEEGAGKSTIVRALLPSTPYGARIDAEDIGQTNPCPMDDTFFDLLRRNVAGLVENFWAAGYVNVIAGSFLRRYSDYVSFRQLLRPSAVFLIDLLVDKEVRDHRRITRAKRTTQEWRDMVDQIPEDRTIRRATDADYRYIGIDTTDLDVGGTVQRIKGAIPEVYAG
jgi:hypothetical protein